ncbi:hypothetical protein PITC_097970 [Penicillium italicum]|uniref:Uncharacterized protein n=1 Tax=Penicillium italicum TaxID=40296 RepID=A0A0A2L4P1_PENIT|nr:hypothetical protein PITC_097970 [Penicillium italicum]
MLVSQLYLVAKLRLQMGPRAICWMPEHQGPQLGQIMFATAVD